MRSLAERLAGLTLAGPALALAGALALVLAGCGIAAAPASLPSPSPMPSPSISPAIALTRAQLTGALGAAGLQLTVPQVQYRPAESPLLAAAPRAVFQVQLPDDLHHGFIVVYEFPDAVTAAGAAREMAGYLQSGPGRVQFPSDAQFILRQLGTTLVFYPWSPGSVTDARAPEIATALQTVGQGFGVAR